MARLNRNEIGSDVNKGAVAVTTTAKLVAERRSNRVSLIIRNYGATDLFFGKGPTLTAADGYPLLPSEEYVFDDYAGAVYIISLTTGDLRFFEVY